VGGRGLEHLEITVIFERRQDGGLRAYSDDVPGFVLSHSNVELLLRDVQPALEGILSHLHGKPVRTVLIGDLKDELEHSGIIARAPLQAQSHRAEKAYLALTAY
jgi:hypothetical protein